MLDRRYVIKLTITLTILAVLSSCSIIRSGTYTENYYPYPILKHVETGYIQTGIASWYGPKFQGRKTANGEIYNMYDHTAASKTLPFNTIVKVTNLNNGKSTIVRINDRGPFVKNRIIDLSYSAAKDIGMISTGTAPVKIVVLGTNPSTSNYNYTNYTERNNESPSQAIQETADLTASFTNPHEFTIQVGSFINLTNALKLMNKLLKHLKNVYIQKKFINGTLFYRVLVGSFSTKKEAIDFVQTNLSTFISDYCIIKK